MFYSNEDAVGLKVVLEQEHWTEKGVYTRGHIMRIKRIEGLLFVLEDDNGELALPVSGFHLLEESKPFTLTKEEVDEAWKECVDEYLKEQGLQRRTAMHPCHGIQQCPGFQVDLLAVTHGTRRGCCRHRDYLGECRRSDYQEDMGVWRETREKARKKLFEESTPTAIPGVRRLKDGLLLNFKDEEDRPPYCSDDNS